MLLISRRSIQNADHVTLAENQSRRIKNTFKVLALSCSFLDYFGPLYIKCGNEKQKVRVCLFSCFVLYQDEANGITSYWTMQLRLNSQNQLLTLRGKKQSYMKQLNHILLIRESSGPSF